MLVAATSHRGKGSPNFIDHGRKLSPDHLAALDKFMLENSANMNLRRATKFMNDTFPNFSFKKATIRYALADGFADAEGGLDLGEGDEHAPDPEEGGL